MEPWNVSGGPNTIDLCSAQRIPGDGDHIVGEGCRHRDKGQGIVSPENIIILMMRCILKFLTLY